MPAPLHAPEQGIAIIGIGYVGLPLAQALADHFPKIVGFDIEDRRVAELRQGNDRNTTEEGTFTVPPSLHFTSDRDALKDCSVYIITVPTPIDEGLRPDLGPLRGACEIIAGVLSKGDLVIVESTVYPGATREVCAPIIAERTGLTAEVDFQLGYSPERINPGDTTNTFDRVIKIIAGQDGETLQRMNAIYAPAVTAGLHHAPSIEVAEAAKVTENIQRDLNIALMNELAMIFDRMDINSADVIEAAASKWNFHAYRPGLVGGHCIGVDPYYLISKAEMLGHYPEIIRAGRRLNSSMAEFVAKKTMALIVENNGPVKARIGVLGITYKEDVPDIRNSQVPAVIASLKNFGAEVLLHDPVADPEDVQRTYDLTSLEWEDLKGLDAVVLAVPHGVILERLENNLEALIRKDGVVVDVKSALKAEAVPTTLTHWAL